MTTYTINNFHQIIKDGFSYENSDFEKLNRFNSTIKLIDASCVTSFPVFEKPNRSPSDHLFPSPSQKSWKYECSASKINKQEGIDGKFNEIRLHLNKMSTKSFESMQQKIHTILDELFQNSEYHEDSINKMSKSIFDIASQNKFYSNLYANLYSNLLEKYPRLYESFQSNYNSYLDLFDNIQYVDPDDDYDKFCMINKENERRKAISSFFVNLVTFDIVTKESLTKVLSNLLLTFDKMINISGKKNEVDEYVENIIILFNKECIDLEMLVNDTRIEDYMENAKTLKSSDYKSLSNKSMFKLRDIK